MSVLTGLIIAWALGGALVLLATRRPNAGRIAFGILFLMCSLGMILSWLLAAVAATRSWAALWALLIETPFAVLAVLALWSME